MPHPAPRPAGLGQWHRPSRCVALHLVRAAEPRIRAGVAPTRDTDCKASQQGVRRMRIHDKLMAIAFAAALGLVPGAALAATGPAGPQGEAPTTPNLTTVQYVEPSPPADLLEDEDADQFSANGMQRCAAQFRSFEPDTGYYTTFSGERVMCPYLE